MLNLEVNPKILPKKLHFTLVESQQLPVIEQADSKDEISCLRWTIHHGRRKVCINFQTDADKVNIVIYRYRNNTYLRNTEMELKLTEYQKIPANRAFLLSYIDIFYKRCIVLDEPTVQN